MYPSAVCSRFGLVGLVSEHVFVSVFVDLYPYGYFVPEFTQEPVAGGVKESYLYTYLAALTPTPRNF